MKPVTLTATAIIFGAAMVAAVFWFSNTSESPAVTAATLSPFRAESQHIYGDPSASITIVEFSDVECPFCARVHPTIERLVDESEGRINWEYRHLPLPFHQNAEYGALMAECVAKKAGNEAFWNFLSEVLINHGQLSTSYLENTGQNYGLSASDIAACGSDIAIKAQLAEDAAVAAALGGSGTPYSVIVFPDGVMRPVSGALPYAQWQALLEQS